MNILDEANRLASALANEFRKTMINEDETPRKQEGPRTIVAYSGHFQPFHQGHYRVYQVLTKKFGEDNVYITTTNQIEEAENPLAFADKKQIITQMFDVADNKVQEVENPFVPKELLQKFSPNSTSFVTVVDDEDVPILHKSKYFHKYVDGRTLKPYNQAGYYLTVPELRAPVGGQALTGPQIMQVMGSPKTKPEVKEKLFQALYGKSNPQIQHLISSKAEAGAKEIDGGFGQSDGHGHVHNSPPVQSKGSGQNNKSDEIEGDEKTPPMKRMITNPDTGREIKVQSALKYPRWKPVYKKAERVLKAAGIDRSDRVKEPEVNVRYKKRAKKNKSNEDWSAFVGDLLADEVQTIMKELNLDESGEISTRLGESGTQPVAIYSGRFQPFHAGHYHAYQDLVKKFGKENVFIASSDKTNPENSPFDFQDKQNIITRMFGVDPSKVVQVKNPYQCEEIISKLPPNTPVVWGLGEKDADRLSRSDKFKPYQEGQPLSRFDQQGGYIYNVPQLPMEINGKTISGTGVREVFAKGTPAQKKQLFTKLYGKMDPEIFGVVTDRITKGPKNPPPPKVPKKKAAEKPKAGAKKFSSVPSSIAGKTIRNPETDNDIQIKTALKYDDSHPVKKAAVKLVRGASNESIILEASLNEALLLEAAPQSHVQHPYDDPDMKFSDLKDIVHQSLMGDFGSQATEKYDGQTLLFTVRDGKVVFARNTQHTKNHGEGAMTADEYEQYFSGHGDKISKTFAEAARDVTNAISKIPPERQAEIFKGGNNFVLSELLSTDLPNTLPYATDRVVMLNIREYDPNTGNPTDAPIDRFAADELVQDINKYADPNAGKFKISGNTRLQFDHSRDAENQQKEKAYVNEIRRMQVEAGLGDDATLGQYFQKKWGDILDSTGLNWTPEERQAITHRWAFGDKTFGSKDIQDPKKKEAFRKIEADYKKHLAQIVEPIKTMVLKVGIDAVARSTNIVSKNDGTKERLQATLKKALDAIKQSDNPAFKEKARDQMEQLKKLGPDAIMPSEGLIIQYNGRLYKLTGSFAPINQVVGTYTYQLNSVKGKDATQSKEPEEAPKKKNVEPAPKKPDTEPTTGKDVDTERMSKRQRSVLNKKVSNPETGNQILVKTALGYDKDHPARKAADQMLMSAETIMEGGNAVTANSKIPNQYAIPTVAAAADAVGIGELERALVGSTHKPLMNDLDVAMDRNAVKQLIGYQGTDSKEFFAHLKNYLNSKGVEVSLAPGFQQFSVSIPLVDDQGQSQSAVGEDGQPTGEPGKVQVDFMMGNLPWMRKYLTNGDQSEYSSTYRNVMVADILAAAISDSDEPGVKEKYQVNTRDGVEKIRYMEKPNGKRDVIDKQFVSSNPDDLAKILFGDRATFADMNTFEKLNQKMQSPDFKYKDRLPQIYQAFRNSVEKLKKELPAGIPQTNDPADVQQQKAEPVPTRAIPQASSQPKIDPELLNSKIKNPETGNDILVKTALKYDSTHPVKKAAMKFIQSKRGSK